MNRRHVWAVLCAFTAMAGAFSAQSPASASQPLAIGETFTIQSEELHETRRINVYLPAAYHAAPDARLPVLYMPDGGLDEDFLHVAGLVQVLAGNGGMRPFLLVGIENTQRRRDLTGPTSNDDDKKIAPVVGGSLAFRRFIARELIPAVTARYRTTNERAIIGESLAGLFVVETMFEEPSLFDTYIAFDPSVWWNDQALLTSAAKAAQPTPRRPTVRVFLGSSRDGLPELTKQLADTLTSSEAYHDTVEVHFKHLQTETHATIFHPAALIALREMFPPPGKPAGGSAR